MMSADILTGVEEEYLRLRSRSPTSVLLDRVTLSGYRAPTCEPLCRLAQHRLARLSAYFSVRPPTGPLQLVPVAASAPPAALERPALPSRSPTSSPPLPSARLAVQLNKVPESQTRCTNAVHSVLCELMSSLPLSPPASPMSDASTASTTLPACSAAPGGTQPTRRIDRSLPPPPRELNTDSTDSAGCGDNGPRRRQRRLARHVATQARTNLKCVPLDDYQKEREHAADEWLGGVRALRDSHVRLVLRQLRHIERLNRALDRASPRTPRSSRSPRTAHPKPR